MVDWQLSCLLTDDVEQQIDHADTSAELVNQFKNQMYWNINEQSNDMYM